MAVWLGKRVGGCAAHGGAYEIMWAARMSGNEN